MGQVRAGVLASEMAWTSSFEAGIAGHELKHFQNRPIAIVDDDEYARLGLEALLQSLGYRIETFASAEDYLASNTTASAACLILDVHLPGMSGPDLQAHLLAGARCPPTVFVTGRFEEHVRKQVTAAGALGYLIKPCSENAVLDCIAPVLRMAA